MSHANPTRDLGVVVESAVELLLAELERKRMARTKRARSPTSHVPKRGRVSAAVRRRVFERDGLKCSYVSPDGRRCDARAFLELDHVEPRAHGGADDDANLRVRCRAHNQFAAEQVFGRKHMDRRRHFVRTKCSRRRSDDEPSDGSASAAEAHANAGAAKPLTAIERVESALKNMGFRNSEVRMALARVEHLHEDAEDIPFEQALREALLAVTPDLRAS
jgi:5-methylcytosine-specific restriction endonuclease McrA